ncbi:MAG: DNA mismatch repair endonuclease MutL [Bacteroidota bacterium]|nr:DNA mismatch repair endonuclease MutL [Bacteroidota bacterium]
MSDIIHLLPDAVANQIAAGEVVQRPASAVKELLENSIDSGASFIQLIIKDAGRTSIQIIDNGCGMSVTDARMSFERHATSKIQEATDLFSIHTLGFRGEALASIASVAQVEMKTRRLEDELGTLILIEGALFKSQEPCASETGTSITVKNLFFNIPARRNFLKSNTIEFSKILDEFNRVALIYPDIAFSLFNNGKPVFQLPKSSFKQRIVNIFGSIYNERLLPVEQETGLVSINGFIVKPEYSRKTKGEQYLFVNKRFIKHAYFNHAIEDAFHELMPDGTYPGYFLNFNVDPANIDVNIHPTKTEVNFLDSKYIYSILKSTVRQCIGKFTLSPTLDFDNEAPFDIPYFPKDKPVVSPSITLKPDYNPFNPPARSSSESPDNRLQGRLPYSFVTELNDEQTIKLEIPEQQQRIEIESDNESTQLDVNNIFQLHYRYIVTPVKSGLMIIDQQLAHERILFERLMDTIENHRGASQQLLFPTPVDFLASDAELVRELKPELHLLGFDLKEDGINRFEIVGIPAQMPNEDPARLIEGILESYKSNMLDYRIDRRSGLIRAMARNLAIRSGKKLQTEEMQVLIDELFACSLPDKSPAGRSTLSIITIDELSKQFK